MNLPMSEPLPDQIIARVVEVLYPAGRVSYALLSQDLKLVQASDDFADVLIDPPEKMEDQPITDLLWEFVGADNALLEVLSGKLPFLRLEDVNRLCANGSTSYLKFLVVPLSLENPSQGLLLIVEDTTRASRQDQQLVQDRNELRLAQAQLARANQELLTLNQLKSLFLSIAAHDLRAPLSAIGSYAEIVQSELPLNSPADHHEFLGLIGSQVRRLDRLIADFLDLDPLERGRLTIQPVPCDLNMLTEEAFDIMAEVAHHHQLKFKLSLAEGPNQILADPGRVLQIFYNLINNAIKYTPEGGSVEVKAWADSHSGVFQVSDTGYGLSESEREHLFDLYFRTESSQQSQVRGSGLGLYIVKSLVDAQHGQIEVSSPPGAGTTFTVRLPAS